MGLTWGVDIEGREVWVALWVGGEVGGSAAVLMVVFAAAAVKAITMGVSVVLRVDWGVSATHARVWLQGCAAAGTVGVCAVWWGRLHEARDGQRLCAVGEVQGKEAGAGRQRVMPGLCVESMLGAYALTEDKVPLWTDQSSTRADLSLAVMAAALVVQQTCTLAGHH